MTDPTPNGQTGERICPLATCFGCPDPGRCDALRRGDHPVPSSDTPSDERVQMVEVRPGEVRPMLDGLYDVTLPAGERPGLTLREAAIEAILIREQDTAFSTVARIIAALPAPSPEASDERPGWADLMAILDEVYPSDVFGLGHPDPGPQIVGYLRAIDKLRGRDPRPAPSSSPVGRVLDECSHGITLAQVTERCAECGTVVAQGPAPMMPLDVTALPEWSALVEANERRGDLRVELAVTQAALHQACHDGWSDAHGAMAGYLRDARAAAADQGEPTDA